MVVEVFDLALDWVGFWFCPSLRVLEAQCYAGATVFEVCSGSSGAPNVWNSQRGLLDLPHYKSSNLIYWIFSTSPSHISQ